MKRKSIIALTCTVLFATSLLLIGCGEKTSTDKITDNGNNATQKIQESADDVEKAAKDGAKSVKDGVEGVGNVIKYTAMDLKNDIVKAGYEIKDSADNAKNYFKGKETDYIMDKDFVRVYEYDNTADLDADISTISADGITINNVAVYKAKPYYFRKGNSLIIYEGSNPKYVDEFETLYGPPIL